MFPIASGMTLSVAANSESSDLIIPTYQNLGAGVLRVIIKSSAVGMKLKLKINGVPIADNIAIPFTGTTGTMDYIANVLAEQKINGGRVEMTLVNGTAGALTTDYVLQYEPTRK